MPTLSVLPGTAHNQWGYNGVPFAQDNVVTVGDVQYAVWWDTNREPIIGKRDYPSGDWSTVNLAEVAGNPLSSPVALDGHNTINLGVDASGRLHVAGNMHNNTMRYVRSVNPGDITVWESTNRPGDAATSITYPQFMRLSNGRLFVWYRVGSSGFGDNYLQEWDTVGGSWNTAVQIVDGIGTNENPYLHRIAVGQDNSIHLAIVWRGTGNANTNNDLCHMRSLDGGTTWEAQDGTALTLPVTHSTAPLVLDTADTGSGLLNTSGIDVDPSGRPHIATHIYNDDATSSRVLYSYWDGAAWVNEKLFDWTYKMPLDVSVVNGEVARPVIFSTTAGRVFVIYRNNQDGLRGAVRIREVTPEGGSGDAPIVNLELYAYEPAFDTRAVRDRGELHMLITPCRTADPAVPEYTAQNWAQQPIGILTVTIADLDAVLAGTADIPDTWVEDTTTPPPEPGGPVPVATAEIRTRVTWLGCALVTGRIIAELPDITGTPSRVLGASTSTSLDMPIPIAGPAALGETAFQATQPGVTMVIAVVNDIPTWGGIVLTRTGGSDTMLKLGCVSLEGYLERRFVGDHTWVQQDEASVIAAGLIADANTNGIGLIVDAPATGVLRDREYLDQDDATVYSRLGELMRVDNGPEWTIDLDWADDTKQVVSKILRVRSRIGKVAATPGAVFHTSASSVFSSRGTSEATYEYTEDYSEGRGANNVIATSSGEGEDRPQSDPSTDVRPGWPQYDRRYSPSSSITSNTELDGHAAAELARRLFGANTWKITTRWDAEPRLNVDWQLGDDVAWELAGHRHPAGVRGQGRCIGWSLDTQAGTVQPILWDPSDEDGGI